MNTFASETCLGCGQPAPCPSDCPAGVARSSNLNSLLSIARSYVYGGGATFADLEEAVGGSHETNEQPIAQPPKYFDPKDSGWICAVCEGWNPLGRIQCQHPHAQKAGNPQS